MQRSDASELLKTALVAFLGALIGLLVWDGATPTVFLLAVLPILWPHIGSWFLRTIAVSPYFGVSLWPITYAVPAFFTGESSRYGVLVYALAVVTSSALFALVAANPKRSLGRLLFGAFTHVALIVPPVGVAIVAHPAVAAGWLLPGSGIWGLVASVVLWTAATLVNLRWCLLLAVGVCTLGVLQISRTQSILQTPPPMGLRSIDTLGNVPTTPEELALQLERVKAKAKQSTKSGDVVVLPESSLVNWQDGTKRLLEYSLLSELPDRTWIMGALLEESGDRYSGLVLISDGRYQTIRARQPMFYGLWRPWDAHNHISANWSSPGVIEIGGRFIAWRVCSEELTMFWAGLDSLSKRNPEAMIGMINVWWATSPALVHRHQIHAQSGALLMGLPLLRAINWPSKLAGSAQISQSQR